MHREKAKRSGSRSRKVVEKKSKRSTKEIGLSFPVGRIGRKLREMNISARVSISAAIAMTAMVNYLTADLLDLCVHVAGLEKKTRITPDHILEAIRSDHEMSTLFKSKWICQESKKTGKIEVTEVLRNERWVLEKKLESQI